MRVSVKKNYVDFSLSSGYSLKLAKKSFLKNYYAKSDIKGSTERKISFANLTCASGYTLRFEKYMALENVQFLIFCPFFGKYSFFQN